MKPSIFLPPLSLSQKARDAIERHSHSVNVSADRKILSRGLKPIYRVMPNHLARASLFAPIAKGRTIIHFRVLLASRRDANLIFTGTQFNEPQADAWMQLIFEYRNTIPGEPCSINRCQFLQNIGRSISGRDYNWLRETMIAFTEATLIIEVFAKDGTQRYSIGRHKAFHMISSFEFDPETDTYTFTIDPQWKQIFGEYDYSLIDWQKRMRIRKGQDLAKAIQRIICASSNKNQRFALDDLKSSLQYGSPMHKFRKSLRSALKELKRVEIISDFSFHDLKSGAMGVVISRG